MSETPDQQVRHDAGGWISGPMMDAPLPRAPASMVPPNSTALRELHGARAQGEGVGQVAASAFARLDAEEDEL